MKRTISLLLVLASFISLFAMFTYANASVPILYYVDLPAENNTFAIKPLDGYSVYVPDGEPFEFYLEPKEGYTIRVAIVSVDDTITFETEDFEEYFTEEDPARRYFKIDAVTKDVTVKVTNVTTEYNAGVFEFLVKLINSIVDFFQRLFSGKSIFDIFDSDFDPDLGLDL